MLRWRTELFSSPTRKLSPTKRFASLGPPMGTVTAGGTASAAPLPAVESFSGKG
jgi:hypothetical protein